MIVFRTLYLYKTHIELIAFYRHYIPYRNPFELFEVLFRKLDSLSDSLVEPFC